MLKTENKPKHKIISEWIVSRISSGEFSQGDKIPSENELAERFSFSRQTVRQAIANLESGGILVRIKGCGTFVGNAPTRFREKTYTIGVVISCLDDYVFPSILQGIENYLTKNGYLLSFGITYNKLQNEANALSAMIKKGVDGIIVEGTKSALPNPNAAIYKQLKDENTPFIFINGYYENIGDGYVVTDDVAGGSIMAKELIKNGHSKIGGIFKSDDMQGHKRFQGFSNEMKCQNLAIDDDSILWYTTEDLKYFFDGGCDSMIVDRLKNCTAVVCYNDLVAVQLIEVLKRNGRTVPDDMSIVSFDNSSLAEKSLYNLTSVIYPSREIGSKAAEMLLQKIQNPNFSATYKFGASLVKRNSIKNIK